MPPKSFSPSPTKPNNASLLRSAFFAPLIFFLLQWTLWAMGAQPSDRANVWWWTALSTLAAKNGFFNVWTPYPPIFTLLHYVLTQIFAGDLNLLAQYFFEGDRSAEAVAAFEASFVTMKAVWTVFNAAFLIGQGYLIYRLTQWRLSKKEAMLAAGVFLLFNLSWRSQIVIGLACDQFDYFPSFFFLWGLLLLIQGRANRSALIAGMGAMIKIYPGLLVPLAWSYLCTTRRALKYTAVVVAFCLVLVAPFLYVNSDIFLATYQWSGSRPGWESVWIYPKKAFPTMPVPQVMLGQFDTPIPEVALFRREGPPLQGRLVEESERRVVLEFLNGEQVAIAKENIELIQWMRVVEWKNRVLMLITILLLLALTWVFRKSLRQEEGLLRGAFLFVLVLLFFSKGISSYFLLWFFPFLFILYPPLAACGLFTLFLLVGNLEFTGMISTPGMPTEMPWYWTSIFLRQALILGLAIDQGRRMWKCNLSITPGCAESEKRKK